MTNKTNAATKKTDADPRCKFRETNFKKGNTGAESSERVKTINQPMAYRKLSLPRLARREIITIAAEVTIKINIEWTTSARTALIVDLSNTGDGFRFNSVI